MHSYQRIWIPLLSRRTSTTKQYVDTTTTEQISPNLLRRSWGGLVRWSIRQKVAIRMRFFFSFLAFRSKSNSNSAHWMNAGREHNDADYDGVTKTPKNACTKGERTTNKKCSPKQKKFGVQGLSLASKTQRKATTNKYQIDEATKKNHSE